ncbi:MAG: nucleotidyltransferase family protein, partial [Prevotella sp.]
GSYSRGEQTKDSDVDILVLLDKSRPIGLKFFGMWNDLEELLGRKVDLVSDGTLLPFAQQSADNDKILIYERGK